MVRIKTSHYTDLLRIGVPIMLGQLSTIMMGLADTLMVGHYGTKELAAAGFVNNTLSLLLVAGMGFSYGLTPVVGAYPVKVICHFSIVMHAFYLRLSLNRERSVYRRAGPFP